MGVLIATARRATSATPGRRIRSAAASVPSSQHIETSRQSAGEATGADPQTAPRVSVTGLAETVTDTVSGGSSRCSARYYVETRDRCPGVEINIHAAVIAQATYFRADVAPLRASSFPARGPEHPRSHLR